MSDLLPADRVIEVTFRFKLPVAATLDEIDDWVAHCLHCRGLSLESPLLHHDLEAISLPTLTDTGKRLVEERIPTETPGRTIIRSYLERDPR